jgi:hypothetical protein
MTNFHGLINIVMPRVFRVLKSMTRERVMVLHAPIIRTVLQGGRACCSKTATPR